MSAIAIRGVSALFSAASLAVKLSSVKENAVPSTGQFPGIQGKRASMVCMMKNGTQFELLLEATYFSSGRYDDAAGGADPFEQNIFTLCNRDNAWTGVSGGASYRIAIDNDHYFDFAIGWTAPLVGPYTAGVVAGANPQDGYEKSSETGNSINSPRYEGTDEDGKLVYFHFHVSAAPGSSSLYVITQVYEN